MLRRTVLPGDQREGVAAIGPAALAAVLCAGSALGCLALALARVGDRTAGLTHAVMGLAMAGMASPWGDPVPAWAGATGFTLAGAGFVMTVLRGARPSRTTRHLAISCAAMVLMYLTPGHGAAGGPSLVVLPLTLVLAGYFGWHAWTCVDRARAAARPPNGPAVWTPGRGAARMEPVAHGAVSALMATMFLGAV